MPYTSVSVKNSHWTEQASPLPAAGGSGSPAPGRACRTPAPWADNPCRPRWAAGRAAAPPASGTAPCCPAAPAGWGQRPETGGERGVVRRAHGITRVRRAVTRDWLVWSWLWLHWKYGFRFTCCWRLFSLREANMVSYSFTWESLKAKSFFSKTLSVSNFCRTKVFRVNSSNISVNFSHNPSATHWVISKWCFRTEKTLPFPETVFFKLHSTQVPITVVFVALCCVVRLGSGHCSQFHTWTPIQL